LVALNHFTVPMLTGWSLLKIDILEARFRQAGEIEFLEGSSASKPAVPVDS
jgi:hypothetical protein